MDFLAQTVLIPPVSVDRSDRIKRAYRNKIILISIISILLFVVTTLSVILLFTHFLTSKSRLTLSSKAPTPLITGILQTPWANNGKQFII